MKQRKLLLPLLLVGVMQLSFAGKIEHCETTYENSPFKMVMITDISSESGLGTVECDYKHDISYQLLKTQLFSPSGGYWGSGMPVFQWCAVDDGRGNSAATCGFVLMYGKK